MLVYNWNDLENVEKDNLLNIPHFTQSDIDYDDAFCREVSVKLL